MERHACQGSLGDLPPSAEERRGQGRGRQDRSAETADTSVFTQRPFDETSRNGLSAFVGWSQTSGLRSASSQFSVHGASLTFE